MVAHQKEGGFQALHRTQNRGGLGSGFGRLSTAGDKFMVVSEAVQAGEQYTVKSFDPAREDTGWNLAAAKGIETAAQDFHGADRLYNVAVLPAEGGFYASIAVCKLNRFRG